VSLRLLRQDGLPVTTAWGVPEAAEHLLAVSVPGDWSRRTTLSANELCRRIAQIAKGMHGTQRFTRVLVCTDDIDLSDLRDLILAWQSRCHPANGHFVLEDQPANPVEPMYDFEVLNCLLPVQCGRGSPAIVRLLKRLSSTGQESPRATHTGSETHSL
jgi:4-hydroxy-3-polyprenylbenzoate decarboxylase